MKVPSNYVIATFQLYGSLMLESPDYFFRVREIGRLRQTRTGLAALEPLKQPTEVSTLIHDGALQIAENPLEGGASLRSQ